MFTAKDVADYMLTQVNAVPYYYQENAVREIRQKFGAEFIYTNENGNPAISKTVLKEFKKISEDVIWERGDRCWRKRRPNDTAGSRAQD